MQVSVKIALFSHIIKSRFPSRFLTNKNKHSGQKLGHRKNKIKMEANLDSKFFITCFKSEL
jgi:hypothetical protein